MRASIAVEATPFTAIRAVVAADMIETIRISETLARMGGDRAVFLAAF